MPTFKEGDKVTYAKRDSDKDGKNGTFIRIREDGKYSITFDDGKRLAANPKNIYPIGEAPKWTRIETHGDDFEYSMLRPNNVPSDFYFYVRRFNEIVVLIMTSVDFFEYNGCIDDCLGSHLLSQDVKEILNRCGVYADCEMQESMWEGLDGFSPFQIKNNMILAGFRCDPDFDSMLENDGF